MLTAAICGGYDRVRRAKGQLTSAGGVIPDGTAKKNPHLFLGDGKDAAPNPCLLTKGLPPARVLFPGFRGEPLHRSGWQPSKYSLRDSEGEQPKPRAFRFDRYKRARFQLRFH